MASIAKFPRNLHEIKKDPRFQPKGKPSVSLEQGKGVMKHRHLVAKISNDILNKLTLMFQVSTLKPRFLEQNYTLLDRVGGRRKTYAYA